MIIYTINVKNIAHYLNLIAIPQKVFVSTELVRH